MSPPESIKNTVILPFRLFELFSKSKIIAEKFCPDDRFYVADHNGRIHCFEYHGRIPRPEDEPAAEGG